MLAPEINQGRRNTGFMKKEANFALEGGWAVICLEGNTGPVTRQSSKRKADYISSQAGRKHYMSVVKEDRG